MIGHEEGDGILIGEPRLRAIDLALRSEHSDVVLSVIESLSESLEPRGALSRLRDLVASPQPVIAQAALQAALKVADEDLEARLKRALVLQTAQCVRLLSKLQLKPPRR